MIYRILLLIHIFYLAAFFGYGNFPSGGQVLGATTVSENEYPLMMSKIVLATKTAFDQKEVEDTEVIPYETVFIDDEELEYGKEEVVEVGANGEKTSKYLVTHWLDDEIDRVLIDTIVEDPVDEVIAVGKKIFWHELGTPDEGTIKYWAKLTVFATKYDSTCPGCNNTTALGAPVHEGVCAVDPKVIPLYTHFYVPGYGKCQALDVGGLVKGNKIDLAYRDASTAPWGAQYVDIYLLDNAPSD